MRMRNQFDVAKLMNTLIKMASNSRADFASFATRRFSTLTAIFGYLDGVGSHKNTIYE